MVYPPDGGYTIYACYHDNSRVGDVKMIDVIAVYNYGCMHRSLHARNLKCTQVKLYILSAHQYTLVIFMILEYYFISQNLQGVTEELVQ